MNERLGELGRSHRVTFLVLAGAWGPGRLSRFALCLCQSYLPAPTHPLEKVIGQASPEGLTTYLLQTPYAKLPQPDLGFQPGVGKFGHRAAPAINRLRGRGPHLFHKGRRHRHVLGAKDPTRRDSRTTLLPKSATAAVRGLPLVDVVHHPRPRPLGSPPPQVLSCRAAVGVALGIIGESLSTKLRLHP